MSGHTGERLVRAAASLLDEGGQGSVTLRAVAELVGVSHNAPYRHFKDRNALLAAVAEQDFRQMSQAFRGEQAGAADEALRASMMKLVAYAREHPARYRLLFSDPDLASAGGNVEAAALDAFQAFGALVQRCQEQGGLPQVGTVRLTGLIYATLHGAIDIELGGRAKEQKGLGNIEATVELLLALLRQAETPSAPG